MLVEGATSTTLRGRSPPPSPPDRRPWSRSIAVFGPTASGKSAVAEELAERLGTEVVSCDALQVYRGLPILTNQPARPTRLVAIQGLDEEMSVGVYAGMAHEAIDELVALNSAAVVVGGTGLYLRAALADLAVPPPPGPGVRERIRAEVERDPAAAHRRLEELDRRAADVVHENDARRLVRALELAEAGSVARSRRRPALGGAHAPSDPDRRARRPAPRAGAADRGAHGGDVRRRGRGRGARRAHGRRLAHRREGARAGGDRNPAAGRGAQRIVVRTRRYAAYQRKWMRRVPGILSVDGSRSPGEIAETILQAASAGV